MRYPKKPIITLKAQIINFLIFSTSRPKLFITRSFQVPTKVLLNCGLNVSVRRADTNENPARTKNKFESPISLKHSDTTNGKLIVKNAEPKIIKPLANPRLLLKYCGRIDKKDAKNNDCPTLKTTL